MLGDCEKCHGPLCVSGRQICCERCGHIHDKHAMAPKPADKKPAPPETVIPPQDYAATIADRLLKCEKTMAAQALEIQKLKSDVAKLQGYNPDFGVPIPEAAAAVEDEPARATAGKRTRRDSAH